MFDNADVEVEDAHEDKRNSDGELGDGDIGTEMRTRTSGEG